MKTINKESTSISGWIVLDKPISMSSAHAVAIVKRHIKVQKVGHTGTLDPLATGVLPLALGKATKMVRYIMGMEKEYIFSIVFGQKRTTGDQEGDVVATTDFLPSFYSIQESLPFFKGAIWQSPPIFSAIKVNGKRAYSLARAKKDVALAPRQVHIFSLCCLRAINKNTFLFRVVCGKGMYVRSLACDIAKRVGSLGFVGQLRRTRVGDFLQQNTISLDKFFSCDYTAARYFIRPIDYGLRSLPAVMLSKTQSEAFMKGCSSVLRYNRDSDQNDGQNDGRSDDVYRVYGCEDDGTSVQSSSLLLGMGCIFDGCLMRLKGQLLSELRSQIVVDSSTLNSAVE